MLGPGWPPAASLQETDEMAFPLGICVRERLQLGLLRFLRQRRSCPRTTLPTISRKHRLARVPPILKLPGLSAFYKDESGAVFQSYSSYACSPEEFIGTFDDPGPRTQKLIREIDDGFLRCHDDYPETLAALDCCAGAAQ
jgi:hypothetical protein